MPSPLAAISVYQVKEGYLVAQDNGPLRRRPIVLVFDNQNALTATFPPETIAKNLAQVIAARGQQIDPGKKTTDDSITPI